MWGKKAGTCDGYWLMDNRDDDNDGFEHHEQKVWWENLKPIKIVR